MKYNVVMENTNSHLAIYQCAVSLAAKYRHATTKLAESFDLTGAQLGALCLLEPDRPVPMKRLCVLLNCDASNITGIIDRLVQRDLIQRKDSQEDRRIKMIGLTKKGIHLRQVAIAHLEEAGPYGMSQLSAVEKQQLAALLEKAASCTPH
jgi:DNA-binding MarR family transcriptional regulator